MITPLAKLYSQPPVRGGGSVVRRARWHLFGRLGLVGGLGLSAAASDAPAAAPYLTLYLGLCVLVLAASIGLAPRPNRLYPPLDMALLALLIRETGGVASPLTGLSYLWFFGALFYLRQEHARTLPLLAASSLAAVAAGTCGGTGWELEVGAHALGLGACALLGRRFLAERSENRVDPLTRVLGRRYGSEQLTAWLNAGTPFSVAFLDLHGFKAINDRYGHGVSDEVLGVLAVRLGSATRRGDLVMRYGGDEFIVGSRAPALAARLAAALNASAQTSVGEVALHVDIGEATWQGGETLSSLLGRADAAMYRCKAAARRLAPAAPSPQPPAPAQASEAAQVA